MASEKPLKGSKACEAFDRALKSSERTYKIMRNEVEEHKKTIFEIAKNNGFEFTSDDMNKYLRKKHNPPNQADSDTCFSEAPEM